MSTSFSKILLREPLNILRAARAEQARAEKIPPIRRAKNF
jgi:hypothetical protein